LRHCQWHQLAILRHLFQIRNNIVSVGKFNGKCGHQAGFSLLEVLITGAIMSSGLAGLAALLFTSVSGTAQSAHQTTASMLADGMVAMQEISPSVRQVFLQSPPATITNCDQHNFCSASQFSQANLSIWQQQVENRLPRGRGVVCLDGSPFDGNVDHPECDGDNLMVVKVFWLAGVTPEASTGRLVKVVGR
jgi:type IV pilus assembly protein PilV